MNSIKMRLQENMKQAMKEKDALRLDVIRMVLAAIKQKEVDERIEVDEVQSLSLIEKQIKQSKESLEMFKSGGREDLVQKESFAIDYLKTYLPQALSDNELKTIVEKAMIEVDAKQMQDMGKVMSIVKPLVAGRADMSVVSKLIKDSLQ